MHTSLAAWQARLKDKEPRVVTRHKRLPPSGNTDGGGVFAPEMGVKCLSSIVIIFIQFHHFVRSRVTVRAVGAQPDEQRHSGSIHNDDTSEGVWPSKAADPTSYQPARLTHTHTHRHSIDGVWGYACPSDLSLFNKIRLLGVCVGGWLTVRCLCGTWEITVSQRTQLFTGSEDSLKRKERKRKKKSLGSMNGLWWVPTPRVKMSTSIGLHWVDPDIWP